MRLVVTGITGFVGSHFAEHALREGHQVVGLCNSTSVEKAGLREALTAQGAKLVSGDIVEPATLAAAMKGADCVCHIAAAFRESGVSDEYFMQVNSRGTGNVVNAAAAAGVRRVVLCSTAGVYGQRVPGVIDETSPVHPWNAYERSKIEAEKILRELATVRGVEHVILRPTAVYGPRDQRLRKLFRSAARGKFPLIGPGLGRRHMVYVTDLADAFLRACVLPGAASQELIIAGPEAVPLRNLLEQLAIVVNRRRCGPRLPLRPMQWLSALVEDLSKVLKVSPPLYRRRMDFYINDAAFSTARAQSVLGWRPRVKLREGLALTDSWYRATLPHSSGKLRVRDAAQPTERA
jgi:nucleoside-diphosphate-sugar epimerase